MTTLRTISAGQQNVVQRFFSGEVDFVQWDWSTRLSGETISASGVSAFLNVYMPLGYTAYLSGTASAASGLWFKVSATGAYMTTARFSAAVNTTSGKRLIDWFDVQIWSGQY